MFILKLSGKQRQFSIGYEATLWIYEIINCRLMECFELETIFYMMQGPIIIKYIE